VSQIEPADPHVTPILHLLDEMSQDLEVDTNELALLFGEARGAAASGRVQLSAVEWAGVLERLDRSAEDLEARQESVLRLVKGAIDTVNHRVQPGAAGCDLWASPWQPPQRLDLPSDVAPTETPITVQGRRPQQLARALMIVGVLLIALGLLTAVL
jgi:hypothetical protein